MDVPPLLLVDRRTTLRLWGWQEHMTTPGGEKRCEGPFWSKMAFVWVARPTQALATCAQHQSAAVQTAGGPSTHAECSRANTCPDHTLGRFYQRTDCSNANIQPWLHSQVTDHTTEAALPCGCWLWRKLEAICYIYGVYKHISKMRNQCTVYLVKIWVAHIHCKPFKKKRTQLVTADACVLFHSKRTEWM